MRLLIDGYNLLHQSNLMGVPRGSQWLEKARQRLIDALAENLKPAALPLATIVFDRHSQKQIDADQRDPSGIQILFAVDHPEADDLIEHLIARHPQPRQLTLVSSDHRLQTAAARRGVKFHDSDVWFDRLISGQLATTGQTTVASIDKPDRELTDQELSHWMNQFGIDSHLEQPLVSENAGESLPEDEISMESAQDPPKNERESDQYHPFPEGYGEDLLDD